MNNILKRNLLFIFISIVSGCFSNAKVHPPASLGCEYHTPGDLLAGTQHGTSDTTTWAPSMYSPAGDQFSVAKSQIYNPGGGLSKIRGGQCHVANFTYPHRDTFCEPREANRSSLNCPSRKIHQGIDINIGSSTQCDALLKVKSKVNDGQVASERLNIIPIYSADTGVITNIGKYTVDLRPKSSEVLKYRYMHMNMRNLPVSIGDTVKKGQIIGYLFDDFGGSATTLHLHFEIIAIVNGIGQHVSPYKSYVESVERQMKIKCEVVK